MATHSQKVAIECANESRRRQLELQATGLATLFGRWEMLPSRVSPSNLNSIDVEIPDFKGEHDLDLIRMIPGVIKAVPFDDSTPLPDVMTRRRELIPTMRNNAA